MNMQNDEAGAKQLGYVSSGKDNEKYELATCPQYRVPSGTEWQRVR